MNHRLRLFIVSSFSYLIAACTPHPDVVSQTALDQLARAAVRQETTINSSALSGRLLSGSDDLILIDIRGQDQFAAKHIKQATNDTVTSLVAKQSKGALPTKPDIVVYDEDGGTGAQAAALLRLAGRTNTYYLRGGYQAWQNYLAKSDDTPKDAGSAQAQAKKAAAACWYEGDYVAIAGLLPKAARTIKPSPGYIPSLQPAKPPSANNTLGLGLDLGLGPEATPPPPANNGLGLGLGLGLGPQTTPPPVGRLKIGEGC